MQSRSSRRSAPLVKQDLQGILHAVAELIAQRARLRVAGLNGVLEAVDPGIACLLSLEARGDDRDAHLRLSDGKSPLQSLYCLGCRGDHKF